jgi:hypothetical protein
MEIEIARKMGRDMEMARDLRREVERRVDGDS